MKTLLKIAFAAAALTACTTGSSIAAHLDPVTTCTSANTSGDAPTGSYEDGKGHKWAGYKQDGMPPDSLTSGGSSVTTCTTTNQPI